jgi:hypothetical protein
MAEFQHIWHSLDLESSGATFCFLGVRLALLGFSCIIGTLSYIVVQTLGFAQIPYTCMIPSDSFFDICRGIATDMSGMAPICLRYHFS